MGRPLIIAVVVLVCAAGLGCTSSRVESGAITQFSTINSLMVGRYDGEASLREMLRYGDFGLGTFNELDGEMIVLDGKVYQAKSDGTVSQPSLATTTPLAVVAPFRGRGKSACPALPSLGELEKRVDTLAPGKNTFAAIRVDGTFTFITMRSVPRQGKPYVGLAEAVKGQSLWTRRGIAGTLVGFRCPRWVEGVNVPGYHWHFVSADRSVGGHVIDCGVEAAVIACSMHRDWLVKLGASPGFDLADLDKSRANDLEQVERMRGAPATR